MGSVVSIIISLALSERWTRQNVMMGRSTSDCLQLKRQNFKSYQRQVPGNVEVAVVE